jgi:hypothetical protein
VVGLAEIHREIAPAIAGLLPRLDPAKTEFEITTKVTGSLRRTAVSSSPTLMPKLPSPITATHFTAGRAKCAPIAAAIE